VSGRHIFCVGFAFVFGAGFLVVGSQEAQAQTMVRTLGSSEFGLTLDNMYTFPPSVIGGWPSSRYPARDSTAPDYGPGTGGGVNWNFSNPPSTSPSTSPPEPAPTDPIWQVCNNSFFSEISVAVAYLEDPETTAWVVEGWYQLSSGECLSPQQVTTNRYVYVFSDAVALQSDEIKEICVHPSDSFSLEGFQLEQCPDAHELRKFSKVDIQTSHRIAFGN